jgi:hypothetical protein
MWRTILSSALCAAVSFWSATTFGVTLIPSVKVGATYDLAGNLQSSTGLINDGAPHVLRLDFFSSMSGLGPNQSFGGESFDIQISGGLARSALLVPGPGLNTPKPNFVFNNPVMINIASGTTHDPILNFFPSDVGNLGISATDLIGLEMDLGFPTLASVGNTVDATTFAPVPDPRLSIGVGSPFQFGSVYLNWDGTSIGTVKVVEHQFAVFDVNLQRYLNAQDLPNGSLSVPDTLFTVPEPTSCVLAGMGGIGMLPFARRLRFLKSQKTGPV